jgi:Glycosyltransferase 61
MKSIVKRVLPSTWIAVIANTLNKLNRLIVVPFFFKEYPSHKILYLHNLNTPPVDLIFQKPIATYEALPLKIKDAFISFNKVSQQEFVTRIDNCLIEPKYGWPLTHSRELIYDCFPYSRQNITPTPSIFFSTKTNTQTFDEIISFREIFEFGYWHFHTDILHKNYLLKNFPEINVTVPILISKYLSATPHFKFFYENTNIFKHRNVIIQDNFLVSAKTAYFLKPMPHKPLYYQTTSEAVERWKGDTSLRRKVFLNRGQHRGRFISNLARLEPVFKKYEVERVDADTLNIQEQIKLFSETALLIGIHGAGLTNMMFRAPQSMNVLELFPMAHGKFEIPPHYFLLSNIFGFTYQAILGSPYTNNLNKSFDVDPMDLDRALNILCK